MNKTTNLNSEDVNNSETSEHRNDSEASRSSFVTDVGPELDGDQAAPAGSRSSGAHLAVESDDDIRALLTKQARMIEQLQETQNALQKQLETQSRREEKELLAAAKLNEKQAKKQARIELRVARAATRQDERNAKRAARDAARQEHEEAKANLKLQRELERDAQAIVTAKGDGASEGTAYNNRSANDGGDTGIQSETLLRFFQATLRHAGFVGGHGLRLARRGGKAAGRATTTAVEFVDDDVRSQFKEAPLLGLMQLLPYDPVPYRQPTTTHPPLIMIHGLAGSAGNFSAMRLWLALHRPRPVHTFDYRGYNCIFAAAEAFGVWMDEVLSLYPEEDIEILAHSMGGLLARHALLCPKRAERIAHMITLGTPHHGTNLARWGGAAYVRQLRINSPVFQHLEANESTPLPYPMTSLWSERDVMVLPPRQSIFDVARSHEMSESTHLGWLLHPRFMEEVFNMMDAPRRHVLEAVSAAG